MTPVSIDDYSEEKQCTYKGERYSARDNGAVIRHPREGKRNRSADSNWTFGKENTSNPYLHISGVQVHRIVATAFHGDPDDSNYVVDHIDTNCRNNRPENLRWLTRLENVLKNPATRRKVEFLCGSIEAFLDNPSLLRDTAGNPNFGWMRVVTHEEAENCKARMHLWANSLSSTRSSVPLHSLKPQRLSRLHQPLQKWEAGLAGEPGLDFAMSPRSAQYMWSAAIHFPCCPAIVGVDPLDDYVRNIGTGAVLAYSDDLKLCPELTVHRVEYLRDRAAVLVLCSGVGTGRAIIGIEVSRGGLPHFIHFNLGSYSSDVEANEAFAENVSADFWSIAYSNAYKGR